MKFISSEGDIEIQGSTNRYFCRDFYAKAGRDIIINFITMFLTNYVNGMVPNVNILADGSLMFKEAASISGGYLFFRGSKSLSFAT